MRRGLWTSTGFETETNFLYQMKTKQWDVVVVGGVNSDYLIRGPRLPQPGESVQGDLLLMGPGGKGANQGVAAARLGARVGLVARVGKDDRGVELMRNLDQEGVDTSQVTTDAKASTGAALVMVDAQGEKQILASPGANDKLRVRDIHEARGMISSCAVLLMQLEVPMGTILAAARLARRSGAQVVLDPAPFAAIPEELFPLLDVIRPNATEAQMLTGIRIRNRGEARKAADALMNRGVKMVAVQAGSEGDLLRWNGGEKWLPRLPVKSVDATGAGDAFAAAFSVGLAEGRDPGEAGLFANAAAALATRRLGAQTALPRRRDIERLLAGGTVER
jgi:ribokinase